MNIEDPAVLKSLMDRMDALEAKTAADAAALEEKTMDHFVKMADQFFAGLSQVQASVDQGVIATSNGIQQILTLMRRIDGATIAVKLGPEAQ